MAIVDDLTRALNEVRYKFKFQFFKISSLVILIWLFYFGHFNCVFKHYYVAVQELYPPSSASSCFVPPGQIFVYLKIPKSIS